MKNSSLFWSALALISMLMARGDAPESGSNVLHVAFTDSVFTTVNQNDALAAIKVWVRRVTRNRKIPLEPETTVFNTLEELQHSIDQQTVNLMIMNVQDYFNLTNHPVFDAVFTPKEADKVLDEYLLLIRSDKDLTLDDLRGKRVIFIKATGAEQGRMWMDCVLHDHGLPLSEHYFVTEDVIKPSAAILPVFFGQAQACVVDASGFGIMKELNPQIGRRLRPMLTSPPLCEYIICIHKHYSLYRQDIIDGLAELHTDPAGQQILTVFKIDKLNPFQESYIVNARKLWQHYRQARPPE